MLGDNRLNSVGIPPASSITAGKVVVSGEQATTPVSHRETYNTGICDCTHDIPSLGEALFCPYCFTSQQYHMLSSHDRGINYVMCSLMMIADCTVFFGCGLAIGTAITRRKARRALGLRLESPVKDFLMGWLLFPCSICQVYREMSLRNMWTGSGILYIQDPFVLRGSDGVPIDVLVGPHQAAPRRNSSSSDGDGGGAGDDGGDDDNPLVFQDSATIATTAATGAGGPGGTRKISGDTLHFYGRNGLALAESVEYPVAVEPAGSTKPKSGSSSMKVGQQTNVAAACSPTPPVMA